MTEQLFLRCPLPQKSVMNFDVRELSNHLFLIFPVVYWPWRPAIQSITFGYIVYKNDDLLYSSKFICRCLRFMIHDWVLHMLRDSQHKIFKIVFSVANCIIRITQFSRLICKRNQLLLWQCSTKETIKVYQIMTICFIFVMHRFCLLVFCSLDFM